MSILTIDIIKREALKNPGIDPEAKAIYDEFSKKFGYAVLENLSDDELLDFIFPGTNKTNLCHMLEHGKSYSAFGSVTTNGWGVHVYCLYNQKGNWCARYKGLNQKPLTDQVNEPLRIGKSVRDELVAGAKVIRDWEHFDTEEDYKRFYNELNKATDGLVKKNWVRKYYHMLFPEHLTTFYTEDFCDGVLNDLGLQVDGNLYAKLARISCFINECGISTRMMGHLYHVLVYGPRSKGLSVPYFDYLDTQNTSIVTSEEDKKDMGKDENPRNRIFFGAPGTGKSYLLNLQQKKYFHDENVERVTFHPDYSYANFVGTYKPVTEMKTTTAALDPDVREVVEILTNKNMKSQDKYDALYDRFKSGDGLTRLPLLLSLYSVEGYVTRKEDGSDTKDNNNPAKNHGKALQKYVMLYSGADEETSSEIEYRYVPGPFMRVYTEAVKNPKENFLLIIEEINRANVAAVFGDVFQLLDRKKDGEENEGESEYPIQASEDIRNYLARELGGTPKDYVKISIPANMYIWATMNSADQGVFPMDTAFKRRWDFEYIGIDDQQDGIVGKTVKLANGTVEWNALRKAINDFLAENNINEDKQLGPYFISSDIVAPDGNEIDSKRFISTFKNKVIMYLYEDAARQKRKDLFDGCGKNRYSEICKDFDENGYEIFNQSIVKKLSL